MTVETSLAQPLERYCGLLAWILMQACASHDLLGIAGAQALMQPGAVHLDGLDAQTEVVGHLFATESITNEIEHLLLSGAEFVPHENTVFCT